MKIYSFGHGKTISWFGSLNNKQEKRPTIIFTRAKTPCSPDRLGKLVTDERRPTLWGLLNATHFIFKDVDTLRFWLRSTLRAVDILYGEEE
jgi:hypothetical protein